MMSLSFNLNKNVERWKKQLKRNKRKKSKWWIVVQKWIESYSCCCWVFIARREAVIKCRNCSRFLLSWWVPPLASLVMIEFVPDRDIMKSTGIMAAGWLCMLTIAGLRLGCTTTNCWPLLVSPDEEWPEAELLLEAEELEAVEEELEADEAGELQARLEEGEEGEGELQWLLLLSFSAFIITVVEEGAKEELLVTWWLLVLVKLVVIGLDSLTLNPPAADPWCVFRCALRLHASANLLSHTLHTCGLSPAGRKKIVLRKKDGQKGKERQDEREIMEKDGSKKVREKDVGEKSNVWKIEM